MARPKKNRDRFSCGKLKPETASPAVIRTIIDQAKRGAGNPLLRTEVGRLRLNDVITDRQTMAATRFAAIVGTYDRLKGMPRRTLASPSYEAGYGSHANGDREDDEIIEGLSRGITVIEMAKHSDRVKATMRATRRYDAAISALVGVGLPARRAVEAVALRDEMIVAGQHLDLRRGLDALAEHFAAS